MIECLKDYDWAKAFEYAGVEERDEDSPDDPSSRDGTPHITRGPLDNATALDGFTRDDVESLVGTPQVGEHDGRPWVCAGRLKDGRWFCLSAGCDYTGWDCQADGGAMVASSEVDLLRFCVTDDEAHALEITAHRKAVLG